MGGSPELMAREAPSRWGPAGIGGLLHPSREASRGAVRIGSSRGADSPAHDHGHESLKCRLSQWETSALNFGGTCAFPGSAPLGAGAALTVRLEALGSTGRNRGVSFRCLGSRQSVFQDTWCLFLTFIRPHTPKPWCQGKADDSPEGRGRRVLGLAAGRRAEGQTDPRSGSRVGGPVAVRTEPWQGSAGGRQARSSDSRTRAERLPPRSPPPAAGPPSVPAERSVTGQGGPFAASRLRPFSPLAATLNFTLSHFRVRVAFPDTAL